MLYRIVNWSARYENNRTREIKHTAWVPVPNKMDGDGYTALVDHKDGAAHFGAWIALLEIASRCEPRGTLARDNGKPHNSQSLARISRLPAKLFDAALARLCGDEVGWLEVVATEQDRETPQEGATISQEGATISQGTDEEQNGTERKEQKKSKRSFGEFENVKMTDAEHAKLLAKEQAHRVEYAIKKLDAYIEAKGKRYKSHYAVLCQEWPWEGAPGQRNMI